MIDVIHIKGRELQPQKSTMPTLGLRTVLTNNPWDFVSLWLKRKNKKKALFYWQQAEVFANAGKNMPVESAPLLYYYSFMNATKALLSAKSIQFEEHHGIRAHNIGNNSNKIVLSNEGVKINQKGIAPALSKYFAECEADNIHSLKDLFFNIPCVHRTFCLTYKRQREQFIPLTDCKFVIDKENYQVYFSANLSEHYTGKKYMDSLPASLIKYQLNNNDRAIRSKKTISLSSATLKKSEFPEIIKLHKELREDLHYIAGSQTLWYVKSIVSGCKRLDRAPLTCMLLAMHRLSELSRYKPMQLASFLSGQENWLLTEFISMSPIQFIDEISAEITGFQFMTPNVRPAT